VIGANMRRELFVALHLKDAHHFIEGSPRERTRRLEPPLAFGATKTTEPRILDPYKLPDHGRCRCATILSRTQRSPFAVLYYRLLQKTVNSRAWRKMYRDTDLTCANLGGLSRILHTRKTLVYAQAPISGPCSSRVIA
jgi:hypothetical protein